jgi:hypothetical protein
MDRNSSAPWLYSLLVIFLAFSIFMIFSVVVQAGTTFPHAWVWQVDDPPGPQTVFVAEQPDDEFGEVIASGDVNGDGFEDLIVGARSVGDLGFIAGEVYVLPGPFAFGETYTMPQRTALRLFGSMAGVELGAYVDSGDMNGDGYDDIVIGALGEANTYL